MKETELYDPVKIYLESLGYTVKAEVGPVDVFAMKNERTIAVELKTQMSLKLIYQAIERQKICDDVYIAIPKSAMKSHQINYRSFMLLLRRLSIGLMMVSHDQITVLLDPSEYNLNASKSRNKKKHIKLIDEFNNRKNNLNVGGTKGQTLTLYREKAILIAQTLKLGILSPKSIKQITKVEETASILQKNYYGWFKRVSRGQYELTEKGRSENQESGI